MIPSNSFVSTALNIHWFITDEASITNQCCSGLPQARLTWQLGWGQGWISNKGSAIVFFLIFQVKAPKELFLQNLCSLSTQQLPRWSHPWGLRQETLSILSLTAQEGPTLPLDPVTHPQPLGYFGVIPLFPNTTLILPLSSLTLPKWFCHSWYTPVRAKSNHSIVHCLEYFQSFWSINRCLIDEPHILSNRTFASALALSSTVSLSFSVKDLGRCATATQHFSSLG